MNLEKHLCGFSGCACCFGAVSAIEAARRISIEIPGSTIIHLDKAEVSSVEEAEKYLQAKLGSDEDCHEWSTCWKKETTNG